VNLNRAAMVILLSASLCAGCTRVPSDLSVGHAGLSCAVASPPGNKEFTRKPIDRAVVPVAATRVDSSLAEPNTTGTAVSTNDEAPEVERSRHIADLEARFRRWDETAERAINSICYGLR
jgi:hypothetical protein